MGDHKGSLERQYSKILIENGIAGRISKVKVSTPQELVGTHFGGICEYVTITFEDKPEEFHLFVKKILSTVDPGQIELLHRVILKEAYMLTTLQQDIKALCQRKFGVNSDFEKNIAQLFPKVCFSDNTTIVMEDLIQTGFKMVNRRDKQDFQHATLVLNSLAKFHGVSHVLIKEMGGKDKFLENNPVLADWILQAPSRPIKNVALHPPVASLFRLLEESDLSGTSELLAKLEKYKHNWHSAITEVLKPESIFPVINHGDCWNNNMMFNYSENGGLQNVNFYDLQASTIRSPAADLGYYIYTSLNSDARSQWKSLLEVYFNTLENTLKLFGQELHITFREFLKEYARVSKMGFLFGLTLGIGLDAMQGVSTDSGSLSPVGNFEKMQHLMNDYLSKNQEKGHNIVVESLRMASDFEKVGTL